MYTKMTRIKQGKAGLNYLLNESAHNGKEKRNEYLTGVNLVDGVSYFKQFQYYWDKADDRHEVQVRHIILSFSDRELDPKNPAHIKYAHENFAEYIQENFPNRQALVGTQIDGKTGLVHCHAMVNDCDMISTAGCSEQQRYYKFYMQTCDKFMEDRGIVLDRGRNHDVSSKKTYEQIYEMRCEEILAERAELADKLMAARAAGDTAGVAKIQQEINDVKDPYIWKEHLRQRIQEAKDESKSYSEFTEMLDSKGVIYDDSGKHNKFRLKEEEYKRFTDKPYPTKSVCRGKTLNEDFARDALKAYFDALEIEEEQEEQVAAVVATETAQNEPETAETAVVEEITETTVEAENEAVDEPQAVSSEIADVEPILEQSEKPRVGRRSTKKRYIEDIIKSENDEGEEEDEALVAAGYAVNADSEEISDDEADALERMRRTILEAFHKGESITDEDEDEEEKHV